MRIAQPSTKPVNQLIDLIDVGIVQRRRRGSTCVIARQGQRSALSAVAALAVVVAVFTSGAGAKPTSSDALPRNETLYTSGTAWGPFTNFNPLRPGYATGVLGLLYETLFRYDPLKDRFIPWLATSGKWQGRSYVVTLRSGVTWNDGKPLTAADVKFTFETGKLEGSQFSTMWKTGLQRITTSGRTVKFNFKGTPNYQDWDYEHVLGPDRAEAHLVELQRDRHRDGQHRQEVRRHRPVHVRRRQGRRHRRCSGTGATAGGRPRRSG